jgi:phage shock protein C
MSVSDELGKLGDLHQRGMLSDDEFARAKARVLNGTNSHDGSNTGYGAGAQRFAAPPVNAINALRRSVSDRWIGGVCGGIAQVTGIASWVWRLVFIFGLVFAGSGVLLYILMWILVPQEPLYLTGPGDQLHAG